MVDKDYPVSQGVGLQIVLTGIQADNGGKDFLCLICITIDQGVDSKLFSALMLVFGIKISILVFLSIYRVKLRLAESCIICVLHWIVMIPLIEFLCLELLMIELRLLVRLHKSDVGATKLGTSGTYSAARKIVLVGKAFEAILLILFLHLMNLSLQILDFLLFSILLPETARIDLYIIS